MAKLTLNRTALERSLCRQSLFDFFVRAWPLIVADGLVLNWHIEYLCNELQALVERAVQRQAKEYDLVTNISPGTSKSTIFSAVAPAWIWTRDPSFRMICGSYSYSLAVELAEKTYQIVTSEWYQRLFPEVKLVKHAMHNLKTDKGGQRIVTSTGARITGFHAHLIIIDDPLNPKEAVSEVGLKKANAWFDQTLMSRMVDKKITPLALIMQRLHQDDPSAHIQARQGGTPVRHICLPAVKTDLIRPRVLRRHYVDGLFDPVRLPQDILDKTAIEMGQYAYSGQYMQNPIPLGGGMFRVGEIQIYPSPERMGKVVRYWDKAGTVGKGCFTVGVKMGMTSAKDFWILDVVRGQWEANEREKIIRQTAELDGKGVKIYVEQEPGSGGKDSAKATVRNLMGFRCVLDRPVGDKALRADPFSAQVNAGNVRMVRAGWNMEYLRELQFFPFSTYKDQVDASSGAFSMLVNQKMMVGGF